MDLQLKGKKVLVTGSTAGIGFATARALAAESASVMRRAVAGGCPGKQPKRDGNVPSNEFSL